MCETLQREYEEGFRNGEARSQASIRKMQAELDEKDSLIAVLKGTISLLLDHMPDSEETRDMMAMIASIQ